MCISTRTYICICVWHVLVPREGRFEVFGSLKRWEFWSCRYTKQRHRSDNEVQQQVHDDVHQRSQNYAFMLHNLMVMIQEYLLLSDDNKQRGALNSLHLVGSTAQLREDNRICIWLEDVWSER